MFTSPSLSRKSCTIPSSRQNHRSVLYHVFIANSIAHLVERLVVLEETKGFHQSDQVPFFVDFKKDQLYQAENPITPQKYRKLKTHDALNV